MFQGWNISILPVLRCEHPPGLACQPRAAFRPLAARYHGVDGTTKLREYTPDLQRLRARFGIFLFIILLAFCAAPLFLATGYFLQPDECFLRAFVQNSDVGINWPMFDIVFYIVYVI